jgi:hypothetical protein
MRYKNKPLPAACFRKMMDREHQQKPRTVLQPGRKSVTIRTVFRPTTCEPYISRALSSV